MTYFLLTSDVEDTRFTEVLVNTTKIVSIRLIKDEGHYLVCIEDVNDNGITSRFKTETDARNNFKKLLTLLNQDISLADTMKFRDTESNKSKKKEELSARLADLLASLKS